MKTTQSGIGGSIVLGTIIPAITLIYIVLATSSCTSSSKNVEADPEVYPVTSPMMADTVYESEYVADIQSVRHVQIMARVGGFVEQIHVDEGQLVKAGQVLFSIGSKPYQSGLLKATANLKSVTADAKTALVELQNVKRLVEKGIVAQTELEMAQAHLEALEAKIEEARSEVDNAERDIGYTAVRAPFDGFIDRIPNKEGSLIEEGMLLTTISDNSTVLAYFNMSESEYLDLVATGEDFSSKEIGLVMANGKPYQHRGMINTVEGEIEKSTGNIAFRAVFPNPDLLLRHGGSGKVMVRRELENALLIPQKSTFEIQDKTYVFVVDKNNTVERRAIDIKLRMSQFYVVESGLIASDLLIYEGIQLVQDGDVITPSALESSQVFAQLTAL